MPDSDSYASPRYSNIEFSVTNGQTNYDVLANNATFDDQFAATLPEFFANKMVLRTDQTITVRVNSATNDAITVTSTDSPFTLAGVEINNVYITNASGNTAAVKILLSKVIA